MAKLETLEHSMAKITMEIAPEDFEAALNRAYLKNRNQIALPGFRKGKAPRKMIERAYGKGVFYEEAINDVLPELYSKTVEELKADVVSRPEIDIETIEDGKPVVVTATVAVKPEVKLGEYKGIVAEKETVAVTEDDVEEELKRQAERNSRLIDVTDRPAAMEDEVNIDYLGTVDGVAFDGGKAEGYKLKLGSHSFVDTFEDQIVGHNVGDEFDVNVTFPENYHEELAGKNAVFAVKLNGIQVKELPALDDDYAKDYSEFETMAEYKENIHKTLLENKQKAADAKRADAVLEQVVANAEMDIADAMIETRVDDMVQNMANNMRYQGFSMEQYLQMTGTNMAQMRANMRESAEKNIKEALVLEAVAAAENLEVTEEDFDAELQRMADMYKMEVEKLKENVSDAEKEGMMAELKTRKAQEWLTANAKEA